MRPPHTPHYPKCEEKASLGHLLTVQRNHRCQTVGRAPRFGSSHMCVGRSRRANKAQANWVAMGSSASSIRLQLGEGVGQYRAHC